jgi:hypothetical protein
MSSTASAAESFVAIERSYFAADLCDQFFDPQTHVSIEI